MFVKIGLEYNEVRRIKGRSTQGQISICLLPVLDRLTVALDPHHLNAAVEVAVEVGHQVVKVLGVIGLSLNRQDDQIVEVNQDVAVLTASPEGRNLVLIFRKENAHVVLAANMNILVITAEGIHPTKELPLLLGETLHHLGVPAVEHLFKMLTKFVMLFRLVRRVSGVISVFIHIHYLLLPVHRLLDLIRRKNMNAQRTALRLILFARGGPLP
jgi:hypothetical protein